ncbi:MAG: AraC family transcriptional regulator [Candidatus Marinimicrobia bacterium]|nr:AraC family transcriptional regulator [Candidatus Neomarinimicrobiota bacterium]
MKISSEKIIYPVRSSFKIRRYSAPCFNMPFHYHPEYELVYIKKGSGLRYIGESIHKFKDEDMVLIGPNLAHIWINPHKNQQSISGSTVKAIVLQFPSDLFQSMLDTPEFALIKILLDKSQAGLKIIGETRRTVIRYLETLLECQEVERLIVLMKLLDTLARDKHPILLNITDSGSRSNYGDERIHSVHHFVITCYQQQISLRDAASVAHMEPSAFCRFFKVRTQKTFTQFLNETRIDHACQLLLAGKLSISQIAFDSGFNNLANFYRQFGKIIGKTPNEYRHG